MIKSIVLLGAAPVGTAVRTPAQGPLNIPDHISADDAKALVDVGLARIQSRTTSRVKK